MPMRLMRPSSVCRPGGAFRYSMTVGSIPALRMRPRTLRDVPQFGVVVDSNFAHDASSYASMVAAYAECSTPNAFIAGDVRFLAPDPASAPSELLPAEQLKLPPPPNSQYRLSTHLVEAQRLTVLMKPQDDSQRTAQREIVAALHSALDARRQRIIISQSEVGPVKWTAILLMGLCALIAIAIVHSDNRLTCAIAVALFATGFALSSLLIAAYSRPFTGEISVKPDLLQEVVPSETAASHIDR